MKISIVIPVYNEADNIEGALCELEKYMNGYAGSDDWEIIVINDGSNDKTMEILSRIKQVKKWLKIYDLIVNYGRGRALREGLNIATGDIIVSLDADLSYGPYHIERLVQKMIAENADIVLASAYGQGGTVTNVPFNRLWISRLGNKVLSWMFGGGVTVLTCLVRAYRKEFINGLDLHSNDKDIHLEILYKARMVVAKIVEVPADLSWRPEKLQKLSGGKHLKRRSTLKLRKTSSTHLFFALLNRPGLIFWIPGYILFFISFFMLAVISRVIIIDIGKGLSVYLAIRDSMLSGSLTWFTMGISFIIGIQFFMLGFLTSQNKRNYEETYKTLNAIYSEIKKEK